MMHFLCIKWGNKYPAEYVNNLRKMVQQNYTKRHKFICYTDDADGIDKGITIRAIPKVDPLHPDYWFGRENYCWDRSKFLVLNSHHWLRTKGPFCYLDLDVVIQNNIDEIFELSKTPHMLYSSWENPDVLNDRRFKDMRGSLYNSSVMLWCNDEGEKIYNDVLKHKNTVFKTFWKGTDNYYPWREHQVVGDNYWSFLPTDWVYSYNRGQSYPDDLTEHLYRDQAKFCIFDVPVVPNKSVQKYFKPDGVKDYNILIHWHGKTEFERLWMPKFPQSFFTKNKHTDKISELLKNKDYDTLQLKFEKDLPQLKDDWERYSGKFETLREWLGFDSLSDDSLERNYMNKNVVSSIKSLVDQNDLQSLSEKLIKDFPELEEYFTKPVEEVKKLVPELEREVSDLKFIRMIEPHHRGIIKDLFESGDIISIHLKFCADFPEDNLLQDGDQSLYWNKDADDIYDFYKQRFINKMQRVVYKEAKDCGPVRYFWNVSNLQCFALYKRLWKTNTLPKIKHDVMENTKQHGLQRIFWDSSESDIQALYKKYYVNTLKELFYKQDYEKVFESLYNIMPKQELMSILNQDNVSDNDTLIKYFQMHGEQYSDMYRGLYEDGSPDGALIQLSASRNDTNDPYNDIFLTGHDHNLTSIRKIFDKYKVNWVTLMCELSDPTKSKHFEEICKYFLDNGITLTVQTYDKTFMKPTWIDEVEYVDQPQQTEHIPVVQEKIASDIPVNLETLKMFKKEDEVRRPKPRSKKSEPVWCDARKSGYFYVSADSSAYPCAYIARDFLESKLLPYHPLDYTYNKQYNSLKNFTVGEIIYRNDFENISQSLKRNPLTICNKKCGSCNAS